MKGPVPEPLRNVIGLDSSRATCKDGGCPMEEWNSYG